MKFKFLTGVIILIISSSSFAQEDLPTQDQVLDIEIEEISTLENAVAQGISPVMVQAKIKQSQQEIIEKYGKEVAKSMSVVGISIKKVKASFVDSEDSSSDLSISGSNRNCVLADPKLQIDKAATNLTDNINKSMKVLNEDNEPPRGTIFITWGYNRETHSNSDITFETKDGKFTIHDAQGHDRPSKIGIYYLKPSNFSKPQYNIKIGYWFSQDSKWGIGAGMDHKKWVFDPTQDYTITGDYKDLWVNGQKKTFDEIKAGRDASFLLLEHTDGLNYLYAEALYRQRLLKMGGLELNMIAGFGAGVLVPKTRVRLAHQEDTAAYEDVDNKFHLAGFGVHVDVSAELGYRFKKSGFKIFAKYTQRGSMSKINNALVLGNSLEGRISQTPIWTREASTSIGIEFQLGGGDRRKKERVDKKLAKMKKQDGQVKEVKKSILEKMQEEFVKTGKNQEVPRLESTPLPTDNTSDRPDVFTKAESVEIEKLVANSDTVRLEAKKAIEEYDAFVIKKDSSAERTPAEAREMTREYERLVTNILQAEQKINKNAKELKKITQNK
jgi:hypothetical protein